VSYINEIYGTEFTTEDKVNHFIGDMERRLGDHGGLRVALDPNINPSLETRRLAFQTFFADTLDEMIEANVDIYKKVTADKQLETMIREMLFRKLEVALR
jgi:hypothetical protein